MQAFNGQEYEGPGSIYRWWKSYQTSITVALMMNEVKHYDIYVSPPAHVGPKYLIIVYLVSQNKRIAYEYETLLPLNMEKWFRSRAAWPVS